MKKLILCFAIVLSAFENETVPTQIEPMEQSMIQMMNEEIVNGFFDGDSTKVPYDTYFLQ